MGHATSYFFDPANADSQTLHRRITPTDTQFEEQQTRWNALADWISPWLSEASACPIRSWLQGSYKFATQVRPVHKGDEFDIDLGIYFVWNGRPGDGPHRPKALKELVQNALEGFSAEQDDVIEVVEPPKMRCARIRFKGDFHIDVPCYHLDEARDRRSLATEEDAWESSDPKALYKWFTGSFEENRRSRVRRLVRYVKAWAALKFRDARERPASVLLTVLVANAVAELGERLSDDEDEGLADVLGRIYAKVRRGQDVRNPVDDTENLAGPMGPEAWASFVAELGRFAETASGAASAATAALACSLWSEPFEHLFPLPDPSAMAKAEGRLPAVATNPVIEVSAVAKHNDRLRFNGTNSIGPIPKDCKIRFRVTNAGALPYGTQFVWMVRNEGDEAEGINDLGHKAGSGLTAEESSAYNGTHYMDCTALLGGQVVGLTRVPVRIGGVVAPRRNPPRPSWAGIRGRR